MANYEKYFKCCLNSKDYFPGGSFSRRIIEKIREIHNIIFQHGDSFTTNKDGLSDYREIRNKLNFQDANNYI